MSVKDSVLETLHRNKGNYISGESISGDLGVSRAAIWKAINSLRQEGYKIDAVTNRGYRLAEDTSLITAEAIREHLPARYKGNSILTYETVDSTNLIARRIASGEAETAGETSASKTDGGSTRTISEAGSRGDFDTASPRRTETPNSADNIDGTIVVARQQTAGRGRLGRSFFSPTEGIYLSIIISPRFDITKHTLVTVATAVAVADAVDSVCGQDEETKIKWVNDIYLHGRKICGILTEGVTDFESGRIEHLVVGIGINTTTDGFPEDLRKIAGAVEGDWDRSRLVAEIATGVFDHIRDIQLQLSEGWMDDRFFMNTYRRKNMLIGKEVQVYRGTYRSDPTKEIDGIPAVVEGIDGEGGLIVAWSDGSVETLTTGEVSIRSADQSSTDR